MDRLYIEGQNFEGVVYSSSSLLKGDVENCRFTNCTLKDLHLSGIKFVDCEFKECNLSNAIVKSTGFQNAVFKNCKLLGVNFADSNPFLLSFHFEDCLLNLSSFYNLKIEGAKFKNCKLHEADFSGGDLTASSFVNCDLAGAIFDNSILEKADFQTAFNYAIDPNSNRIKKAKFSMAGILGLLYKHDIEIK